MTVKTPRPWPADSWPPPAELAAWLKVCTDEERLAYANEFLSAARAATACWVANRDGEIEAYRWALGEARDQIVEILRCLERESGTTDLAVANG